MSIKTFLGSGALLGLLGLALPVEQARAVELMITEPLVKPDALVPVPTGAVLTLRAALDLALQASPELTAARAESEAREAEVDQTGRLPNPELGIEVANVAGSGAYRGFDAAETTLQLSQQLELGDKRQLRRSISVGEHERSVREEEIARIEVQARVARHYQALLAAQEGLKLAEEQIVLATQTLTVVEARIEAGRAPAVERYRLHSALAEAHLHREKATLALTTARRILAADLGRPAMACGSVAGDLTLLPLLPELAGIEALVEQNPEVVRRQSESEVQRRSLALSRANRIPDPTIGLGLRNDQETGDNALIFGLSLPLPLFDRNRGNVQAAASRLAAAQAQEANSRLQSRALLAEVWQGLAASCAEARTLRDQIIPLAQATFEAAGFGYQSGKFGVLEVQDAQRSLIAVRERYLEALIAAQLAAIELQRLLGRPPLVVTDQLTQSEESS